jgi:hypothetical protein
LNPRMPMNVLDLSKRFKACVGCPVFCISKENGNPRGAGPESTCIVCNDKTHWLRELVLRPQVAARGG